MYGLLVFLGFLIVLLVGMTGHGVAALFLFMILGGIAYFFGQEGGA